MKKILVVLALVLAGAMSYAQWSPGPGNVYLQTTGNVGIGITNPTNDLQINDATGPATIVMNTTATPTGAVSYNLAQYDMRYNGNTGDWYRNVLRKNMVNGHIEMLQTVKSAPPLNQTMNFMLMDFTTQKFTMMSGVGDAEFNIFGNVIFSGTSATSAVNFTNLGNVNFNNGGSIGVGMGAMAIPADLKLAVAGKIGCKEMEVRLTGFPDFVFSQGYKLRSLYDVENFINENKHLPDVPSAKEVVENGLNVGDMSATLVQKVEELTLYMIQLQKENDALKARISKLEK